MGAASGFVSRYRWLICLLLFFATNITAGCAILLIFCGTGYLLAFGNGHLLTPRFAPIEIKPG